MNAQAEHAFLVIARRLVFYVQLAQRPDQLAAHVAELVQTVHGHSREEILVAVDWALGQADLREIRSGPHGDAVLRRYLAEVVAQLG